MSKFAWVTLTTNDTYSLGALVLAHSLKRVGTAHELAVLVTPGVSDAMRNKLKDVYNVVQEVNVMDSQDAANLALLARPELGITFTKLHCWRLTQYEKCVFLDSDTLVLQNCDELFEREELSAAPDVSWPDCFNSGVFVYKPSLETFAKITEFALKNGSFDGGDQGLLNLYFADWAHTDIKKHLPFIYNVTAYASYCYLPAFKQFRDKIKILHFAGKLKPWLIQFNSSTQTACTPSDYAHAHDLIQQWWNIFCDNVHPSLSDNMAGLAGALSQLRLGADRTPEQEAYEALMRRQGWESGQVDYSGKDSFDNIWKRIQQTLEEKPATTAATATASSADASKQDADKSEILTSADIEDGKTEYDPATKSTIKYKVIEGGYEVMTTTPQPNGTVKTQVRTFWDPKPCSEEDLIKEQENKKLVKSRMGKEIRIDKNTTMLTRAIEGGYEEVYTTVNADGTRSMRTKTFFDSVPTDAPDPRAQHTTAVQDKKNKKTLVKKSSVDSTDSTESRRLVQTRNVQDNQSKYNEHSTIEESRRVTQNIEMTENNRTVRKSSVQEQNIRAVTQSMNTSDTRDGQQQQQLQQVQQQKKKTKKPKSNIPPPPADFVENDSTTVAAKRVPGGVEYTYSTQLESGKTITTTKTVYEEEETELTEEEIRVYKKTLKDAEKHKNVTAPKKLKSESGTKKIVPSENPGDVTTVETIKIEGGTEYHYTTVTAEGIVKKSVKTIYDPVPVYGSEDVDEEEIVEEYEEEIIEPGEKNVKTIETIQRLPTKFEEEVTITHEKKEKKVKKSMMIHN